LSTSEKIRCHATRFSFLPCLPIHGRVLRFLFLVMAFILPGSLARAVTVAWSASPSSGVAGYRIYYGKTSGNYTASVDVGNVTSASLTSLAAGVTYYLSVVAYSATSVLSDFSNEISYTVPTSGTPTVNGGGTGGSGGTTNQPLSSSGYLTSQTLGTLHSAFNGFAGMQILVGPTPMVVTALGRLAAPGNGATHLLKLVDASDGTDVPGGAVSVSMSGATAGQFRYGTLNAPITLAAGAAYYVLSQEASGGDAWYYDDSIVKTTAAATEISSVWGYGVAQWYVHGSFGQSYGTLDLKYSTNAVTVSRYITSTALGSQRTGYSGFAGMQIFVGASPLAVTALGRMTVAGNGGTHLLKLVDASDGSDVPGGSVTVSMSGASAGQFQYANLASPALLLPGSAYYVLSQESSSGDVWYYNDSLVQTTPVATELSGAWGYGPGQWYLNGGAGQAFGPVDIKYTGAVIAKPQRYIIGQTLGTPHSDFSGFAGMRIVVGPTPLSVTALGRMVATGNRSAHTVKLVRGSDGSDVPGGTVSVSTSIGTAGQFQYASLANPVVRARGKSTTW